MPPTSSHVVEGDPSSWKTSYVENAANLFNKEVPVCVKGETSEKIEDLTIRILMGLNKAKQNKASDRLPPHSPWPAHLTPRPTFVRSAF